MQIHIVENREPLPLPFFSLKKDTTTPKRRNAVKKAGPLAENEFFISQHLERTIAKDHFDVVLNASEYKIAQIDDYRFDDCVLLDDSRDFYLFQYKSREKLVSMADYYEPPTTAQKRRLFIHKIISGYRYLMELVDVLNEIGLVHMTLVPSNLFFDARGLPFITNFDRSYLVTDVKDEIMNMNMSIYNPHRIHLPWEFHLLCYMRQQSAVVLTEEDLVTVSTDVFSVFSLSPIGHYITDEFKDAFVQSMKPFIGGPIEQTIVSGKAATTWNNYALSVLFLTIIASVDEKAHPNPFIEKFISLLLEGTSGAFSARQHHRGEVFDSFIDAIDDKTWAQLFGQL